MAISDSNRELIHRAVDDLPDDSLEELAAYINFLHYRETHPGSAWLKAAVHSFKDVQDAVETSGMSEDEVNAAIDEAIDEVRRESDS